MFIDGRLDRTLRGEGLVEEFIGILEDYVDAALPGDAGAAPSRSVASGHRLERPARVAGPRSGCILRAN